MKKSKEKILIIIAYSSLAIAVLSAFTTIVGYTNSRGIHRSYSLIDFLADNASGFGTFVIDEYFGPVYAQYNSSQILFLSALGASAVIFAFIGINRLSMQKDNTVSFVLTILGLVITMIPSLVILFCIVSLKEYYIGTISCGIYPIVSPAAMIVCITAAARMRKTNVEYRRKLSEAKGLIFQGGDL